jgi:hypothetical protein
VSTKQEGNVYVHLGYPSFFCFYDFLIGFLFYILLHGLYNS